MIVLDRLRELASLIYQLRWRDARRKLAMWFGGREKRFTIIYEDNLWLSNESRSGPGSEIENTHDVRMALPPLLRRLDIDILLDAPCGDFNWMRLVDLRGVRYIGVDIVEEVVAKNSAAHAGPHRTFLHRDMLRDSLPKADLVMCRDCLIHFSYRDTLRAVDAFERTGARYLLTNTYRSVCENRDIRTGNWRPINLEIGPFFFPRPLETICESVEQDKVLALFAISSLGDGLRHAQAHRTARSGNRREWRGVQPAGSSR